MTCENMPSGRMWTAKSKSACTSALSGQGLHCPSTNSVDTVEHTSVKKRSLSDCAAFLADLIGYSSHVLKTPFLMAQFKCNFRNTAFENSL